jgi:hypothetical protein
MYLAVDDFGADASSRLVSIRLAKLTLRLQENWRVMIDDFEKVMILLAVAAICGERFTRGEPLAEEFLNLRPTITGHQVTYGNVSSVAAATGFNRETTRRKLNQLVDAKILMRTGNGRYRFDPTGRDVDRIMALVRKQLDTLVRTGNELMRDKALSACDSGLTLAAPALPPL